jgi:hypothetical protein
MKLPNEKVLAQFVEPFYLSILHGNCLEFEEPKRAEFLSGFHMAAKRINHENVKRLLHAGEWRSGLVASWYVANRRWKDFVPEMVELLLASNVTFLGQGLAVSLASLATPECADGLEQYLDVWLSRTDCAYDQPWVMASLRECDRRRGEQRAARFEGRDGTYRRWTNEVYFERAVPNPYVARLLQYIEGEQI